MSTQLSEQTPAGSDHARPSASSLQQTALALVRQKLAGFPWPVLLRSQQGEVVRAGGTREHWCGRELVVTLNSDRAARALLSYDALGFLECFLSGDVDLSGNLYILSDIRAHSRFDLKVLRHLPQTLLHTAFQDRTRATLNVRSHYDIPQAALDVYLDQRYQSYSCGIFERPQHIERDELCRVGRGQADDFDSLEKAQWRKFNDAVEFVDPRPGERLLDVGCGYGGQLEVALEAAPGCRVVGWTHSQNQTKEGQARLQRFDSARWELRCGDYREDVRVYDHITSTGMISHVGPRGLTPYLRNVRRRIKPGGRYLHHALMLVPSALPHDLQVGLLFNKKYVWPGFHWFTLGTHVRALEQNGFEIQAVRNLSAHYAKTTAAWYERLLQQRPRMSELMGEPTLRAWEVFLGGASGNFVNHGVHVYRVYCQAL